jgi:hypothetical protein
MSESHHPVKHRDAAERPVGDAWRVLLREVNNRIETLNHVWSPGERESVFCECSSAGCMEQIALLATKYDSVRRRIPSQFVVKPGHVAADGERIVERGRGYVVVEKASRG